MIRKLTFLLVMSASVAMSAPAISTAAEATVPAGTRAAVGTEVGMTGTGFLITSSTLGPIACGILQANVKITKNDGTTVEASGNTANPVQGGCKNGENDALVTNFNVTKLFANETNSNSTKFGTMSFTAKVDVGTKLVCEFTGVNVKFSYPRASPYIAFNASTGITSANCGTAKLDAEFTLEKRGTSTHVILD